MKRLLLVALTTLAAAGTGCGVSASPRSAADTSEGSDTTAADTAVDAVEGSGDTAVQDTSSGSADTTSDTSEGSGDTAVQDTSTDTADGSADTAPDAAEDTATDSAPPIPEELLFVGNSYTYYNDLDQLVASFATSIPGAPLVTASRVAAGGYRLPQHAADAATDATPLAAFLGTGPYPSWTYVVLQDQSQIPGFPETQQERIDSVAAAVELARRATEHRATTLLFQTWGRRNGDSNNPDRFPDFVTMNSRLAEGYAQMEQAIRDAGYPVRRVPVGAAFATIREEELAAGRDPLDSASLFFRLYASDGSHPSLEGSYLAAATFVCTLRDTVAPPFAFSPAALDAADAARLQTAGCAAARSLASGPNP